MMSLKSNMRFYAFLLITLLAVGTLSGCGESAPPDESPQPERQEPMNTGPMEIDKGVPTESSSEAPGEGVTE